MAQAVAESRPRGRSETLSARIVRFLHKTPVHIVLAIVAIVWLAPTVGLLVTSFRPAGEALGNGWWNSFTSLHFTLDNYASVINSEGMGRAVVNTILISVPATILPVVVCSMAAYAFSWLRFPFRDTIFLLVVAMLMIPVQIGFIPLIKIFAPTGLLNGYGAVWLAHTAFALPFGIFLLRNFFISLPRDLIEAARIDGASSTAIFRTIVVPLSVPAIAAYGIFQFLWVWNDLLMALVYVQNGQLLPMTVKVQNLLSQYGTEWNLLAAGAFLLMAVPLLVFFALQRYFVQGLLAGSVK